MTVEPSPDYLKSLLKDLCSLPWEAEWIEGRKPNFHISARVAQQSDEKAQYIHNRGFGSQHYKQMVIEYLEKFGSAKRTDIKGLLLDKLPDVLDDEQKQHKIKNLLQSLKNQGVIAVEGKLWKKV